MSAPLSPLQRYAAAIAARARLDAARDQAEAAGDEERAAIVGEQREAADAAVATAREEARREAGRAR